MSILWTIIIGCVVGVIAKFITLASLSAGIRPGNLQASLGAWLVQ